MALEVVILAAGKGKRMCSNKPKVLHCVANKTILQHVLDQAYSLSPVKIHVVYGHEGQQVKASITDPKISWVHQQQQLGTGHAVLQALEFIAPENDVLVLVSDIPLLQAETLQKLQQTSLNADLTLLTTEMENPFGLGRILSEHNQLQGIVEEKDATDEQRKIKEINSGVMLSKAIHLQSWLPKITTDNAQGEIYLTDIVALAVSEGKTVNRYKTTDHMQVQGVNDPLQLEAVERVYQLRQAETLLAKGVNMVDKSRIDIRGELICGKDIRIDANVVFEGRVEIEDQVTIAANCVIKNSVIKKGAIIHEFSSVDGAVIGEQAQVGPFARLRPGAELGCCSKVGNFVEMKKAQLGNGSKVSHLSYVGDAIIGEKVNIGAGTITCNYDGVNKHQTIIDDGAFIGSGTQLVAPVHVGASATIGAGTTLRRNAPAGELTLTAVQQKTISGWQRKE